MFTNLFQDLSFLIICSLPPRRFYLTTFSQESFHHLRAPFLRGVEERRALDIVLRIEVDVVPEEQRHRH
jgi:hypothetical protein